MICIETNIPGEICKIDDELKAIYHSENSICIWIFKNRHSRDKFMQETIGMLQKERSEYYLKFYS